MGGAGLQFAFRVFHLLRVALGAMSVRFKRVRSPVDDFFPGGLDAQVDSERTCQRGNSGVGQGLAERSPCPGRTGQ